MEVTERLSLEAVSAHTLTASEHIHRYEFAAALCDGQRVLDLCCGTGYGSAILARAARSVVGVDIDVATIETASHIGEPVRFVAADALAYLRRLEPGEIDTIVCFEGLEHLSELDDTVRELARLSAEGVKLVVTIPNSRTWDEVNQFHATDFSHASATELFEQVGADIILVQYLSEGSMIVDPQHPIPTLAPELHWPERVEAEYANHFVGLANLDSEVVRAALSARLSLAYAPTYNRHIRNIERANRELWRTNARLGRDAFARSGSAAAVRSKREERAAEQQEATVAALETRVAELTETLRMREALLERYISAAQRRASRPTRRLARKLARGAVRASGRRDSLP
jgi:ubiquinone/menaquinone biosynthesis C-methylase UbiE